jgi:hypothetical protein
VALTGTTRVQDIDRGVLLLAVEPLSVVTLARERTAGVRPVC